MTRRSFVAATLLCCLGGVEAFSATPPPSLVHKEDPAALANQNSPFLGSQWTVKFDFGLEPGSFMPRTFPDWAASGARLGVPLELLFSSMAFEDEEKVPDYVRGKSDNESPVCRVEVLSSGSFVSAKGEETVVFATQGGYTMERTCRTTTDVPKPRFLLRFWIDCLSGASRNDVVIQPNTRLFGTIPVWDDPCAIAKLNEELNEIKEQQQEEKDTTIQAETSFLDRVQLLWKPQPQPEEEETVSYRQEEIERLLPLPGSVACSDCGVTIAPKGSLVMPHDEKNLIVGSFAMKPSK